MTRHISPSASPTVDNEERSQCVLCLKILAYPTVLSQTSWDATWKLHIQNTKRGLLIFLKTRKKEKMLKCRDQQNRFTGLLHSRQWLIPYLIFAVGCQSVKSQFRVICRQCSKWILQAEDIHMYILKGRTAKNKTNEQKKHYNCGCKCPVGRN